MPNVVANEKVVQQTSCKKWNWSVIGQESKGLSKNIKTLIKIVQNLHPEDSEQHLSFCYWYLNKIEEVFKTRIIWMYLIMGGAYNGFFLQF